MTSINITGTVNTILTVETAPQVFVPAVNQAVADNNVAPIISVQNKIYSVIPTEITAKINVTQVNNIISPTVNGTKIIAVAVQGLQGIQGVPGVAGAGVPVGGTTGQILAKLSSADYSTIWETLNTTIVAEGTNKYFTNARAVTALTGAAISIFANDVGYLVHSDLTPYLMISAAAGIYTPLTRTLSINGTTYDLSANRSWTITAGGNPAGGLNAVQFYGAGSVFAGDASNFVFDPTQLFVGIQTAAPAAPIHAAGVQGQQVTPPASLGYAFVIDNAVPVPVSGSSVQVNGPTTASPPSVGFNYIDYVYDAGSFSQSENAYQGSGFTCYGQTISGYIFAYRMVNGVRVRNLYGQYFQVTDYVNDSSSLWTISLSSWQIPNGFADGFVIEFSDPYSGGYLRDIGLNYSCTLDNTPASDSYVTSSYQSTSTNYYSNLANYINVAGTNYRSDYQQGSNTDSGYGGTIYLIIQSFFGAGNQYLQSYSGQPFDVTGLTNFDDYGQGGIPDLTPFSSVAFPTFNTAISDGSWSGTANQNDFAGSYTANGSNYNYFVFEYALHPYTGQPYFTGGYNFSINDNNDGNPFMWDLPINPGTGAGRLVWVSVNGGGYQGADIGNSSNIDDYGSWGAAPNNAPLIGSYTGLPRVLSVYGQNTTPSSKYSSSAYVWAFQDDNTAPYIISHTIGSIGAAQAAKLIEEITGYSTRHVTSVNGAGVFLGTTGTYDGDTTITPNTVGYLSSGQTVNYRAWSTKTINSTQVYSPTYASAAVVFPNDGQYRYIDFTIGAVSGATYKLQKVGTGFATTGSTAFEDNTTTSWGASSTVTPTSAPVTAAIFERNSNGVSYYDTPAVSIRNTNGAGQNYSFIGFYYTGGGGAYSEFARIGVLNNGVFAIDSYNHGLEIGSLSAPHTYFHNPSYNVAAAVFNAQAYPYYVAQFKGSSVPNMLWIDAQSDTIYLGNTYNNFPNGDPQSSLAIQPSGTDKAIFISTNSNGADSEYITIRDNFNQTFFSVSRFGKMALKTNIGSANLTIAGGINNETQILLRQTTLPSSPLSGGIEYNNVFYGTTSSNVRRQFLQDLSGTPAGQFWFTDSNGLPITSSVLSYNTGTTILTIGGTPLFQSNIAMASGRFVNLGNGTGSGAGVGSIWYNGTQIAIYATLGSSALPITLEAVLFTQSATGNTNNTNVATAIDSTGVGTKTINANLWSVGKTYRFKGRGFHSCVSAPTINIQIILGTTVVLSTGAVTLTNCTNGAFEFEGEVACRTTGAGGTVFGQGIFRQNFATGAILPMLNTTTVGLNTTAAQAVTVKATWGTASASNTISLTNFTIEMIN